MKYLKDLGATTSRQKISFNDLKNLIKNYKQQIDIAYIVFFAILKKS